MITKKLSGKRILVTAVVLAVAVALAAPAWAQQAPIKWKAQTLWNAQERPQKTFEDFCKRVKVLTNGRLEIEPFPAGAIVPTNETFRGLAAARVILEAAGGQLAKMDGADFNLNDYLDGQKIDEPLLVASPENLDAVRGCLHAL